MVRLACAAIVGGVVSRTRMVKVEVAVLPAASWLVQVTVVVPSPTWAPEAGRQLTATGPATASFALGVVELTVAPLPPVASIVRFECAAIDGGVGSGGAAPFPTHTLNDAGATVPAATLA